VSIGRRWITILVVLMAGAACGSTVSSSERIARAHAGGGEGDLSLAAAPETTMATNAGDTGGGSALPSARVGASRTSASGTPIASGATRSPLQLGLLSAVNDGADQAGVSNGDTFTQGDVIHALVDSYNASGGIGGRRIEPVYASMHSAGNNYETQVQAACSAFTEDHHVAAVVSEVGYYSENLLACLAKAGIPVVSGDWGAPDRQDATRFPLFVTPITLIGDTRVASLVTHLAASGFLQPRNRIGVVVEGCPIDQRVHRNALVPALQAAKLTLAWTFQARCFQSLADYGGDALDLQGAVLQFKQHQVDRVMFVSQAAEANLMNLFSTAAAAQGYSPGYALSSIAAPAVLAQNAPPGQLANARGVGWLPALDTQNPAQSPATATGKRCLDRMKAQGIQPTSNADYTNVNGACDAFGLLDALLRATNGDASAGAIRRVLGTVGARYLSASTVDGRVAFVDGRVAASTGRLFAFVNGRFEYTSSPFAL
jgi:ABC-type branched-subunit amino acid transport system substrate-binding protein